CRRVPQRHLPPLQGRGDRNFYFPRPSTPSNPEDMPIRPLYDCPANAQLHWRSTSRLPGVFPAPFPRDKETQQFIPGAAPPEGYTTSARGCDFPPLEVSPLAAFRCSNYDF